MGWRACNKRDRQGSCRSAGLQALPMGAFTSCHPCHLPSPQSTHRLRRAVPGRKYFVLRCAAACCFAVPLQYLCWAELVLASLVSPNVSFMGHLAGIVAGFIHVKLLAGPLARLRRVLTAQGQGAGGTARGRPGQGHDSRDDDDYVSGRSVDE